LVRIVRDSHKIVQVGVIDDGTGMTRERLLEAFRFGSRTPRGVDSLSKFGSGMKLSALSQGKSLTVVTRNGKVASGRHMTIAMLKDDWASEQLSPSNTAAILKETYGPVKLGKSGTVVLWEELDRLPVNRKGVTATVEGIRRRLIAHLGLHFHRLIKDGPGGVALYIDVQVHGHEDSHNLQRIHPLDPFGYPKSGHSDYPKQFTAQVEGVGELELRACIWPARSTEPEYKLNNRAASQQGFYFYRNNRLIQAGGWNGLREVEPHASLARVAIDLSEAFDEQLSLDVRKSSVQVPPSFLAAVEEAVTSKGTRFKEYLRDADGVYRRKPPRHIVGSRLLPVQGLPRQVVRVLSELLGEGSGRPTEIGFRWAHLPDGGLFRLDQGDRTILLNASYREEVLTGGSPSASDAPLIKLLLFYLLEDTLGKERLSKKERARLQRYNDGLISTIKWTSGKQ
jgi:hypothetical protein